MTDPKIRYDVLANAQGEEDVRRLAAELEKLDDSFDPDTAAKAQRLGQELRQLGDQSAGLDQFQRALVNANEAGRRLEDSSEALRKLRQQLEGINEPTRRQAGDLQRLVDREREARAAYIASTAALASARGEAERLGVSTDNLAASEQRLAQALRVAKAETVELAAAYQRTTTAARDSQAATVAAAEAARRAGAAIESAFGATGVRSIDAIEAEIQQTSAALAVLTSRAQRGEIGLDDLNRAAGAAEVKIARLRAEIAQVDRAPGTFERVSDSLNGLIGRFGALTAVIATVGFAVRPAVESFLALETTTRILTNVTGSAGQAAAQIEFLRNAAQRSGQSFDTLAEGYSKFAASALQTGLSIEQTQAVFSSLATASGALGISTEKSGRALEALSQIASKGVVSMEELRGQLGDALPGVLPALAKELGLTTQELGKVVESGQLLAGEAIPAIGRALQQLAGSEAPVQGLAAGFQRLKNVVLEASNVVATGAFGSALGAGLGFLAERAKEIAFLVALIGESFTVVGRQIGVTVAAIVSRDFSQLGAALREIEATSAARLDGLASRISAVGTAGAGAAVGTRSFATAASEATQKALEGSQATEVQRQSLARLSLDLGKAVEGAERQSQALGKVAEARKIELDLVTRYASESGLEAGQRADVVRASERYQAALAEVLTSRESELQLLEDAIELTRAEVLARTGSNEAADAATEAFRKEAEARAASLEVTRVQVSQADAATRAARLEAEAAKDNAARYGELAKAARDAEIVLEDVRKANGRGKASQEELTLATRNLTDAKKLLKDALNDQNDASKRVIDSIKVESEFLRAQINLEITRLSLERDKLLAQGSETSARRVSNQIRELELKLTEAGTEAKRAEATEIIRNTALQKAQLEAQGLLTPARREELDLVIRKQQAVLLETEAAKLNEQAQRKNNEEVARGTGARRTYNDAVAGGTKGTRENTTATEANTRSKADNAKAAEDAAKAYDKLLASDRALGGADGRAGGIGPSQDGTSFGVRSPGGAANRLPPVVTSARPGNQLVSERSAGAQIVIPPGYTFDFEGYNAAVNNNRTRGLISVNPAQFLRQDSSFAGPGFSVPGFGGSASVGGGVSPLIGSPQSPSFAPAPAPAPASSAGTVFPSMGTNTDARRLIDLAVDLTRQRDELSKGGQQQQAAQLSSLVSQVSNLIELLRINSSLPAASAPAGRIEVRLTSASGQPVSVFANSQTEADAFISALERAALAVGGP